MKIFILLVFIKFGYSGGPSTAEFYSAASCAKAAQQVEAAFQKYEAVKAICVEK